MWKDLREKLGLYLILAGVRLCAYRMHRRLALALALERSFAKWEPEAHEDYVCGRAYIEDGAFDGPVFKAHRNAAEDHAGTVH